MFKSLLVILSLFIFTLELSSAALHDHQAHESTKENCSICAITHQSCDFDIAINFIPKLKPTIQVGLIDNQFCYQQACLSPKYSSIKARAPPINL